MGAFSDGLVAGYIGGAVATDPKRAIRRFFALLFTASAGLVIIIATVIPQLAMMGENTDNVVRPQYEIAWLNFVMAFVIVIAGAKFSARLPFSVFRLPAIVIASLRTSIPCIVAWIIFLGLCVITFLVVTGPFGILLLDILVIVAAFIAGGASTSALKKLQLGAEEVQIGVARAMNAAPESVQMSWTGSLLKPAYIVDLPYILQREAFPMFQQHLSHALPAHQIADVNEAQIVLVKP